MEYNTKIKNKNIPYCKVGNTVFSCLRDAEVYCDKRGISPDDYIEYEDGQEFKKKVIEIAAHEQAVLNIIEEKIVNKINEIRKEIKIKEKAREKNPYSLDADYERKEIERLLNEWEGLDKAKKIVFDMFMDMSHMTQYRNIYDWEKLFWKYNKEGDE